MVFIKGNPSASRVENINILITLTRQDVGYFTGCFAISFTYFEIT